MVLYARDAMGVERENDLSVISKLNRAVGDSGHGGSFETVI